MQVSGFMIMVEDSRLSSFIFPGCKLRFPGSGSGSRGKGLTAAERNAKARYMAPARPINGHPKHSGPSCGVGLGCRI